MMTLDLREKCEACYELIDYCECRRCEKCEELTLIQEAKKRCKCGGKFY
jgi:hypothetical protein